MTLATVLGLLLVAGCSKKSNEEGTTAPPAAEVPPEAEVPPPDSNAERPSLTTAECQERGGRIVGDIGDGAIHRPDYTCESGQPPIGSIKPVEGEPIAVEGSVCCPAAS